MLKLNVSQNVKELLFFQIQCKYTKHFVISKVFWPFFDYLSSDTWIYLVDIFLRSGIDKGFRYRLMTVRWGRRRDSPFFCFVGTVRIGLTTCCLWNNCSTTELSPNLQESFFNYVKTSNAISEKIFAVRFLNCGKGRGRTYLGTFKPDRFTVCCPTVEHPPHILGSKAICPWKVAQDYALICPTKRGKLVVTYGLLREVNISKNYQGQGGAWPHFFTLQWRISHMLPVREQYIRIELTYLPWQGSVITIILILHISVLPQGLEPWPTD